MKIEQHIVQDEDEKYWLRIRVEVDDINDISPCVRSLFINNRFEFDSPISLRVAPWSCLELFALSRVFDVFHKFYLSKLKEYNQSGLDYNDAFAPPLKSRRRVRKFNTVKLYSLRQLETGAVSNKLWDLHFKNK